MKREVGKKLKMGNEIIMAGGVGSGTRLSSNRISACTVKARWDEFLAGTSLLQRHRTILESLELG
jgi:hypothetical protein